MADGGAFEVGRGFCFGDEIGVVVVCYAVSCLRRRGTGSYDKNCVVGRYGVFIAAERRLAVQESACYGVFFPDGNSVGAADGSQQDQVFYVG